MHARVNGLFSLGEMLTRQQGYVNIVYVLKEYLHNNLRVLSQKR